METDKKANIIRKILSVFFSKGPQTAQQVPRGDEAGLRARIAALEMDLRDRDTRIMAMQREYAELRSALDREKDGAGQSQLEKLFKKLSGNLSTFSAMMDMAEKGREMDMQNIVELFRVLEKDLAGAGLEKIGKVGENIDFDTTLHQRMSGTSVHTGTPIAIRVPGYRMGQKVLLKALVTTREAQHE